MRLRLSLETDSSLGHQTVSMSARMKGNRLRWQAITCEAANEVDREMSSHYNSFVFYLRWRLMDYFLCRMLSFSLSIYPSSTAVVLSALLLASIDVMIKGPLVCASAHVHARPYTHPHTHTHAHRSAHTHQHTEGPCAYQSFTAGVAGVGSSTVV